MPVAMVVTHSLRCPFCQLPAAAEIGGNRWWKVVRDRHPVSPGHLLFIPRAHRDDFFSLSDREGASLAKLITAWRDKLCADDATIAGFNIGANCGEAAGQTVFHCHIHLIPRRRKDVRSPRGGVRGVIPSKRNYPKK